MWRRRIRQDFAFEGLTATVRRHATPCEAGRTGQRVLERDIRIYRVNRADVTEVLLFQLVFIVRLHVLVQASAFLCQRSSLSQIVSNQAAACMVAHLIGKELKVLRVLIPDITLCSDISVADNVEKMEVYPRLLRALRHAHPHHDPHRRCRRRTRPEVRRALQDQL